MKVINNNLNNTPSVGRLVNEQYAAGQFADCCLYVLPSSVSTFADKSRTVFERLIKSVDENKLINKYDFEVLQKMPILDNHKLLNNAIKEEKCQFVMSLYTPSKSNKQYLLLSTEEWKLYSDISTMFSMSERISKDSINELLFKYALDTPKDFCDNVIETIKSEKFWKNYFVSILNDMFYPTMGMYASMPRIRETLNIDGIITHREKNAMIDRMMENIKKLRRSKDRQAEAELNYVLSSLNIESLKKVLTKMSRKQLETFCKTTNPKMLAQESTMTLEVRYVGKVNPGMRTDGKYRLFLHKDFDQVQVHFGRREAFVLYLIYMIDRKKNDDNVDSLCIEKYRKDFVTLYKEVYGQDEGSSRFDKLIGLSKDEKGNIMPSQIKHCYSDIRIAVSDGCEKLRELPAPFILADAYAHLYVHRNKIVIPRKLIELIG